MCMNMAFDLCLKSIRTTIFEIGEQIVGHVSGNEASVTVYFVISVLTQKLSDF